MFNLVNLFLTVLIWFAVDVYHLGRVVVKALATLLIQSFRLPCRVYLCSGRLFGQSNRCPKLAVYFMDVAEIPQRVCAPFNPEIPLHICRVHEP